MKCDVWRGLVRLAIVGACAMLLTGCVTAKKYRLAAKETPPAVPLEWTAEADTLRLTVEHVIVFKGPGSWKREARWDEYVVRVENTGAAEFTVEEVALVDVQGELQTPGSDPWALEKLSYTNWERYGRAGMKLAAGAGAVTLYSGLLTAATVGSALSGGAAAGGAVAAASIIPVVAVVNVGTVMVMNHQNKKKVVAEFSRRRLELPFALAAGATRRGSWFFPMTPAPQALVVRGRVGGAAVEVKLPLPELARLHLKPPKKR